MRVTRLCDQKYVRGQKRGRNAGSGLRQKGARTLDAVDGDVRFFLDNSPLR